MAAVLAAAGFVVIAAFQAALALGAPLGQAAWGGRQARLQTRLRIASAVAVVFWILAALIVLGRAGFEAPLPDVVERWGTWILVVLLPVGALMNVASSSRWERYLWGPLALILALLTLVVALNTSS
jgi:hypothetical protein